MVQSEGKDEIVGHLVETARAHHAETGGVNPQWARWYAEHLLDDLNSGLDSDMDLDQLESWLIAADERYRQGPQDVSWPKAYAAWLREDYG